MGVFMLFDQYLMVKEKKEEIWLSPMTEAPTPTEMTAKQQNDNHFI